MATFNCCISRSDRWIIFSSQNISYLKDENKAHKKFQEEKTCKNIDFGQLQLVIESELKLFIQQTLSLPQGLQTHNI